MKKILVSIVLLAIEIILTPGMFAQSPRKMSYQAVIRNGSDVLVVNTEVGMQISILQGTIYGASVYVETHSTTTNANGLVSVEIGNGTILNGDFSAIDWSDGPYFIKTETDPAGGTSYTITGTSQLMSVPYALHAKTAETVSGGITETDPVYGISVASGIAATDTMKWNNKLHSETDPAFIAWDKSTGISITESQISDLDHFTTADETDPVYRASVASGILATDTTNWNNKLDNETDPRVPSGTQTGQMQYWNGTEWVTVERGSTGQVLTFINGKPTWGGASSAGAGEVQNPKTGAIWMDKNLGATKVATSSTDASAYGYLYQWGRGTDGHEKRSPGITTALSSTDTPGHGYFITNGSYPYDWRNPQNDNLWQGLNGINNPCPEGYRLPTVAEWDAERTSWSSHNSIGAFASNLKLPLGGYRTYTYTSLALVGSYGYYWTSTLKGIFAQMIYFNNNSALMSSYSRAAGFSVRCIKD